MIDLPTESEPVKVVCGDALTGMSELAPESVDLVVTSPPYNMGLVPGGNGRGMYRPGACVKAGRFRDGYGEHADALPQDEYDRWQRACLAEMWRVARLGVFYNHRPRIEHGIARLPLSMDFGGIPLRQIIIWDRGTGIDVTRRAFCTRQEWVLLFAKPAFRLVDHAASGMGDVWRLGIPTEKHGHPCPFPDELPRKCVAAVEPHTRIVLDPFAGSGTVGVAGLREGWRAILIENNSAYCDIIRRRVAEAMGVGKGSFLASEPLRDLFTDCDPDADSLS